MPAEGRGDVLGRQHPRTAICRPEHLAPSTMAVMDRLQDSAWQYVVEVLHSEDLPMLAAHALVDGHDSPALRELAGLPRRSDADEVRELYVQATSSRKPRVRSRARRAESQGSGRPALDDGRGS